MNGLRKALLPAVLAIAALAAVAVGTELSGSGQVPSQKMSSVSLVDPLRMHQLTDEGPAKLSENCVADCQAGEILRPAAVVPVTGQESAEPLKLSGLDRRITPTPATTGACQATTSQDFIDEVLRLVNEERAKLELPRLEVEPRLTEAARKHSQDMACRNYFNHQSLDGTSPFDRMAAEGYTMDYAAENMYAGNEIYNTPQMAVNGWLNSPSHRASMLNPLFNQVGVGYYYNSSTYLGGFVTMDFGRRIPPDQPTSEADRAPSAPDR